MALPSRRHDVSFMYTISAYNTILSKYAQVAIVPVVVRLKRENTFFHRISLLSPNLGLGITTHLKYNDQRYDTGEYICLHIVNVETLTGFSGEDTSYARCRGQLLTRRHREERFEHAQGDKTDKPASLDALRKGQAYIP